MKKWLYVLLCLALMLALAACGSSGSASGKTGKQPAGVKDVLEQGMAEADSLKDGAGKPAENAGPDARPDPYEAAESPGSPTPPDPTPEGPADDIDVDLTILSATMVYSEVYNMMVSPTDYLGKTIKMEGPFTCFHDEATDNYYFACIIQDATACCAQGIEFVLTDDYTYPDDYPEIDEEICVVGVFDTYREGDYTYCTLRNARLIG